MDKALYSCGFSDCSLLVEVVCFSLQVFGLHDVDISRESLVFRAGYSYRLQRWNGRNLFSMFLELGREESIPS